jgi:hypothetical protein
MEKIEKITKVKNEIKKILIEVQEKENNLLKEIEKNTYNNLIFKSQLEDIIDEYHSVCKKIYN